MSIQAIRVSQGHIQRGKPRSAKACPIALALADAGFPGCEVNPVDGVVHGPRHGRLRLPPEAVAWAEAFDSGQHAPPFTFDIPLPSSWRRPMYPTGWT